MVKKDEGTTSGSKINKFDLADDVYRPAYLRLKNYTFQIQFKNR